MFAAIENSALGPLAARQARREMLAPAIRWWLIAGGFTHFAAGHPARLLRTARLLNALFRVETSSGEGAAAALYALALFETGEIHRLAREFRGVREPSSAFVNRLVGEALLRDGLPALARECFERWVAAKPNDHRAHRMLGTSFVAESRYREAGPAFARSVTLTPNSVLAYQNFAGRYDPAAYTPPSWELDEAPRLLVYDTLGQLAEALEHDGRGEASGLLYRERAMYQRRLAQDRDLPAALVRRIADAVPRFAPSLPCRILPEEWVTQIGHLGMLAAHRKMVELGILPVANYLVLAPDEKVANACYLGYLDRFFSVIRDPGLIAALIPYQRFFGESFMAASTTDGAVEPWTRAAARAEIAWADRRPVLRLGDEDAAFGHAALRALGVPDGAWYVALHVREAGFYGESTGSAGAHRNADIRSYLPAIEEIAHRGGWVIRLGDRSMRPLPKMSGLLDYARSEWKSAGMDVFLLATSRVVIGTTSGLTTAAQAFGTPLLLANCVSNDWQFWHRHTHFILKRVYQRVGGRMLSLAETYRPPVQGLQVSANALRHHGLAVADNSSEEIREAIRYKLDLLDRHTPSADDRALLGAYHSALAENPLMFGAAEPVPAFLARHPELLAAPDPAAESLSA